MDTFSPPVPLASIQALLETPVNSRGQVDETQRDYWLQPCLDQPGNGICFDCDNLKPNWVSLTYGIFICLECSSRHRKLGTHISFVRSTRMDYFTPEQLLRIVLGGNQKARQFLREHGIPKGRTQNYDSKLMTRYQKELDKLVAQYVSTFKTPNTISTDNADLVKPKESTDSASVSSNGDFQDATSTKMQNAENNQTENATEKCVMMTHTTSYGGTAQPRKKIAPLDFDFDFNSVELNNASVSRPSEDVRSNASSENIRNVQLMTQSVDIPKRNQIPSVNLVGPNKSDSNSKFSQAKSISSDDYFFKNENLEPVPKIHFNNSISSDAYFGRNSEKNEESLFDRTTQLQYDEIKRSAQARLANLASAGMDTLNRAREWFNS